MASTVTVEQIREINKNRFKSLHLDERGNAYIVLGNTYPIKDELKAAGAYFKPYFGWYFDHMSFDYPVQKIRKEDFMDSISAADIVTDADFGNADPSDLIVYYLDENKAKEYVKQIQDEYKKATKKPSRSQWTGEVGEKIEKELKLQSIHPFISSFTGDPMCVYKFTDNFENIFTWITSDRDNLIEGNFYNVKGTIKNHSEYDDEKQTVLTRCKYYEV